MQRRRNVTSMLGNVETLSREDDSTLSFSSSLSGDDFAADLIRDYKDFTEEEQGVFRKFVREKALPQHTMNRANNWGTGSGSGHGFSGISQDQQCLNKA